MSRSTFKTFIVSEVLKSYMNIGRDTRDISFYRDSRKREIDPIIQDDHTLHPIEIRSNVHISKDAIRNFSCLRDPSGYEVDFGNVICRAPEPYLITENVRAIFPLHIRCAKRPFILPVDRPLAYRPLSAPDNGGPRPGRLAKDRCPSPA